MLQALTPRGWACVILRWLVSTALQGGQLRNGCRRRSKVRCDCQGCHVGSGTNNSTGDEGHCAFPAYYELIGRRSVLCKRCGAEAPGCRDQRLHSLQSPQGQFGVGTVCSGEQNHLTRAKVMYRRYSLVQGARHVAQETQGVQVRRAEQQRQQGRVQGSGRPLLRLCKATLAIFTARQEICKL